MALTWKGVTFVWTDRLQVAFDALKACLLNAPIYGGWPFCFGYGRQPLRRGRGSQPAPG